MDHPMHTCSYIAYPERRHNFFNKTLRLINNINNNHIVLQNNIK